MSLEINLYAEFLMNVRSVTLYGTLRNRSTTYTKAYVNSDEKTISLAYDGKVTKITLPLGIKVKGSVGFPVSTDPADLSLRLEILEDNVIPHGLQVGNDSVWSANTLQSKSVLACLHCQSIFTADRNIQWKDLPRGLWAETLDQWYCHRPEIEGVVQPGYTGSNGPQLEPGIAFVDTCHFVLFEKDCQGLAKQENMTLQCTRCTKQVGIFDEQLKGYRLYKWALLVKRSMSEEWEKNKVQSLVSAQMLESMEDQNVRKFLIFSGKISEAKTGILLWVFNPDIKYSSSKVDQGHPRRAMKVLYEKVESPFKIADKLQLAVEDLSLPFEVLDELEKDLETMYLNLPEPARKLLPDSAMGKWKVSLLDRFDDSSTMSTT